MEETVSFILEVIGTVACAISGIRLAATKKFDWFGAYTVGLVTAIGGGTLRDLLLDIPVFWMQTWWYLGVTALSLATVIIFRSILVSKDKILFIFDSIGLALFCVIGITKTLAIDYPMWVAVIMGINEEPLVFRKDIYATACLAGSLVYWLLRNTGCSVMVQQLACAAVIIVIRVLTLRYNLSLPVLTGADRTKK